MYVLVCLYHGCNILLRTVKAGPLVCYSTKIAKHTDTNVKIEGKQEVIAPQVHIHKVA